jgi:hypothetical protein
LTARPPDCLLLLLHVAWLLLLLLLLLSGHTDVGPAVDARPH